MRSAMRGRASHLCLVRFDLYLGGPLDGCRRDFEIACIVSRALWDTRFPFQSDPGTDVRHSTNAQFAGSFNAGKLSAGFYLGRFRYVDRASVLRETVQTSLIRI